MKTFPHASVLPQRPPHVPPFALFGVRGESSEKAVALCLRTYKTLYSYTLADGSQVSPAEAVAAGLAYWYQPIGQFRRSEWPHDATATV